MVKVRKNQGITLVALVVTIIIIIILATVTINMAFGDNGLITKAQQAKLQQEIAIARETLTMVLGDALTEKKLNTEYDQNEFLDEFIKAREPNVYLENAAIGVDGHVFGLDRSVPELGEYLGEVGNIPPQIQQVKVTEQKYSEVSVEVITERAEGVTYRYSYKKETESEYQGNVEQAENTYTFTKLATQVIYNLRVELIKEGKVVDTAEIDVQVGKIGEESLTFGKESWNKATASLPVITTTNNQIQYQINGVDEESWTTLSGNSGNIPNIPNGATVFARLWDGKGGSEYISRTIVDEDPPVINEIIEVEATETTIKVQVNAEDAKSGIAKIEYSSDNGENYVTGASVTQTEYEFTNLERRTEYTIKIRVTDNVNNATEDTIKISTKDEEFSEIYGSTTEYTDSEGNTAWIPGGFAVGVSKGINKVSDGLVITDKLDENNYSIGNEFVWIPVTDQDLNNMYTVANGTKLSGVDITTNVYSKLGESWYQGIPGVPGIPGDSNIYASREPDLITAYDTQAQYYTILEYGNPQAMAQGLVDEYIATYASIEKYDGFYIGRYELTGSMTSPTVRPKETVLSNQNWYALKKACSNIVKSSYAQSTMIYGNQWDETLDWFVNTGARTSTELNINSSNWGNYSDSTGEAVKGHGTPRPSRYNEAWQTKNIYDLAGNYNEWTQEAMYADSRVVRGGAHNSSGTSDVASIRGCLLANTAAYATRPTLYIK